MNETATLDLSDPKPASWKVRGEHLPRDWKVVRLGEIIDIQGGSQPPKEDFIYEPREGYVRLLQIRDFGEKPQPTYVPKNKVTKFCTKEDIFIARYGASLGRIVTGMEGAYNVALAKVIFNRGTIFPKYLFYLLQTPYFQTPIHMISRSAQNGFNKGEIFPIEIPLAPYPQQKLIVAEIEKQFSRLDEAVANLKRVKANLKRYKAAVLKAAVEGKLLSVDKERWENRLLGDVLTSIQAGKSFKCTERPPRENEVGVVKVSAVTWGTYDELETKTCLDPSRVDERLFVKPGDFLFSRANTIQLVGACVIAGTVNKQVMLSDKILRLRFTEAILPGWVLYWLRAEIGRGEIQRLSTGNQESMRNIGQDRIRKIRIEVPPLSYQERIVAEVERRLSINEELTHEVKANLKRVGRLRQCILQRTFAGRLATREYMTTSDAR